MTRERVWYMFEGRAFVVSDPRCCTSLTLRITVRLRTHTRPYIKLVSVRDKIVDKIPRPILVVFERKLGYLQALDL